MRHALLVMALLLSGCAAPDWREWSPQDSLQIAGVGLSEDTLRQAFGGEINVVGTPADGEVLAYDSATGTWGAGAAGGGSWSGDTLTLDEIVLDVANADTFIGRSGTGTFTFGSTSGGTNGTIKSGTYDSSSTARYGTTGPILRDTAELAWTATSTFVGTKDAFIGRSSAGTVYVGATTGTADGTLSTGTVLVGDGTVGAPAWSFSGDPDTGFYRLGNSYMALSLGGNYRITYQTTGTSFWTPTYVNSGFGTKTETKTASFTTLTGNSTILCDATAGPITVTLISAVPGARLIYRIKKIDSSANAITIDGNGAETIDGATTQTLAAQYDSLTIQSDGTTWWIQ